MYHVIEQVFKYISRKEYVVLLVTLGSASGKILSISVAASFPKLHNKVSCCPVHSGCQIRNIEVFRVILKSVSK